MTTPDVLVVELVKVVTNTQEVACVHYGGSHLFGYLSSNIIFVNYVGNKITTLITLVGVIIPTSHGAIIKNNLQAPQAPQIPHGFCAPNYVVDNQANN